MDRALRLGFVDGLEAHPSRIGPQRESCGLEEFTMLVVLFASAIRNRSDTPCGRALYGCLELGPSLPVHVGSPDGLDRPLFERGRFGGLTFGDRNGSSSARVGPGFLG